MNDTIRNAKHKCLFHSFVVARGRPDATSSARIAVAMAIAYPPEHQLVTRSATYSEIRLPSGMIFAFAKIVSTSRLIWAIPIPIKPGHHYSSYPTNARGPKTKP